MLRRPSGGIICRPVTSEAELQACLRIRRQVFVAEQRLFIGTDADADDRRAIHIAALRNGAVIGTVRVYARSRGLWWGGRLAVEAPYRGRAGKLLVRSAQALVRQQGARRFLARVQANNVRFFVSLHWKAVGREFVYRGRRHRICEADLGE